ncbi:THUMP domain-containing class I SAM-dependent RNA methyltransferase [Rhodovulum euryhalinum]|uniref:Putative N6-adenine-specific DNA methylase n=1 Tax=Rhodovulum euryhalinum TaxID=35805 RepID=A0A4R2KIB5_9RHOB|nr:class I SAM-dependent RNA methyltransferase [Rhodovulum euryhalinum]TCO72117.1 putative N6-adenine-specific DNA methylase [Rhodovulum euryhalinum]
MDRPDDLDIFLAAPPGLEPMLAEEARALGFRDATPAPGGVAVRGGWPEVWRANLWLRGAGRVLVRIAAFRALHLAQLDKRARRVPWRDVLRADRPVRVEATCRGSKIYHAGAAAQRIERAIAEELGAPVAEDAAIRVLVRIEDDLCTISLDSSGEPLHRRGHKQAVGKAPMRETLAALFLRECGYAGGEPVVDPMCGSGTFVIEAAEIAAGLAPGRSRSFAFEAFAGFDAAVWAAMRAAPAGPLPALRFHGFDRDQGAITASRANAERAGVAAITAFACQPIAALSPPEGPPGLVIVNPPYGGRIGNSKTLYPLYGTLGEVLRTRFSGWRVGLVTSEPALARSTGLPFGPDGPPVPHGGLKVRLYRTGPLR